MSSYDGEDEDSYTVPTRAAPRPAAQPVRRFQSTSSRQPSVISESSHAESSRIGGRGSFVSRLEGTLSPSNRSTHSMGPTDDESYGPAGQRGYGDSLYNGYNGDAGDMGDESEAGIDFDEEDDQSDVGRMGTVWVRERGTPEIMQWEGDLIDTLFDKLEQQAKMVATLRSDPQTSEEEHFKLVLVQTEMERVKYLVRSYVRCRLAKIEKYSHHIVLHPDPYKTLLSGAEWSHAERYTELLHTHFQHSVLDSLPEWLRKMDDSYGDGLSMVSKPNRNVPVLIYCRKDCGEILLEGGETAALAKGTTHLVKYHLVENWIKLGWAEPL